MIDKIKLDGMSDIEIYELIKETLKEINLIEENRLYRDEQLFMDSIKIRNCVEWEIRINYLIEEIVYAINNSCLFAQKMIYPIDNTNEKKMYEYYLTDAVFRLITLWDVYKQLINEFYDVGFNLEDNFSIFNLLKMMKKKSIWNPAKLDALTNYLNSDEHKAVRIDLRNRYAHSFDSTNQYILHKKNANGFITPNFDIFNLPKHQIENIVDVLNDFLKLLYFIKEDNAEINKYLRREVMLVSFELIANCGKCISGNANIADFLDRSENYMVICDDNSKLDCEHIKEAEGKKICKPVKIIYSRINEPHEKTEIKLTKTFEEITEEINKI